MTIPATTASPVDPIERAEPLHFLDVSLPGGAAIAAVATRFGTSERHVRQRLRLGKLAPELLDAYRNGDISLDVVTAFTLGADHAAQLAVWNQLKEHSYIQPYTRRVSRSTLDDRDCSLDDAGTLIARRAHKP